MLERALEHFHGPTLEFGMGDFSTPLLTALLPGVEFHSFENDPNWVERMEEKNYHKDPLHNIHLVDKWGEESEVLKPFDDRHWSVIFIDHGSHYRWLEIERFRDKCDIMVVHDANAHLFGGVNPMADTRKNFKYSCEVSAPSTVPAPSPSCVVASMTYDVSQYKWNFDEES